MLSGTVSSFWFLVFSNPVRTRWFTSSEAGFAGFIGDFQDSRRSADAGSADPFCVERKDRSQRGKESGYTT